MELTGSDQHGSDSAALVQRSRLRADEFRNLGGVFLVRKGEPLVPRRGQGLRKAAPGSLLEPLRVAPPRATATMSVTSWPGAQSGKHLGHTHLSPTKLKLSERVACAQELPEELRQQCLERLRDYELDLAQETAARHKRSSLLQKMAPVGMPRPKPMTLQAELISSSSEASSRELSSRGPTKGNGGSGFAQDVPPSPLSALRAAAAGASGKSQRGDLPHAAKGNALPLFIARDLTRGSPEKSEQRPEKKDTWAKPKVRQRPRRPAWEDQDFWNYDNKNPFTPGRRGYQQAALPSPGRSHERSLEDLPPSMVKSASSLSVQSHHDIIDARRAVAAARDALTSCSVPGSEQDGQAEPLLPMRGMGSFLRTSLRYAIQA